MSGPAQTGLFEESDAETARGGEGCHRSMLAQLLVELGRRLGMPAIYCGETH